MLGKAHNNMPTPPNLSSVTWLLQSLPPLLMSPSSSRSSLSSSDELMNSALEGRFGLPFDAFFVVRWKTLDLFDLGPIFSLSPLLRFPRATPASDLYFLGFPTTSLLFCRASIEAVCALSSAWVSRTHLHAPVFQASQSFRILVMLVMSEGLTNSSRGQPITLTPYSSTIALL